MSNDILTVSIHRASDGPEMIISIKFPMPAFDDAGWMKEALEIYSDDGQRVVDALVKSLPGGTLAQVHARLCQHFADKCLLRVTGKQ